jgi:hypothetical protein
MRRALLIICFIAFASSAFASPSCGCVGLSWLESTPGTTFTIYRATTPGAEPGTTPIATGVSTTSFQDRTGISGTTYYYKVTSVLNGSESAYSNEASARYPSPPPAPPTNLVAKPQ